jgi:hypothetical protein
VSSLKIRIYKGASAAPDTTVTIPLAVLRLGHKLVPRRVEEGLRDQGVDLGELIRLSDSPEVAGTLVEIEDHRKNERVVVAIERE